MQNQRRSLTKSQATTKPETQRSLNSAAGTDERSILIETSELLNAQAQKLADALGLRLTSDINTTSPDSQENTKMMLDWIADIYSLAADIQSYLNPAE